MRIHLEPRHPHSTKPGRHRLFHDALATSGGSSSCYTDFSTYDVEHERLARRWCNRKLFDLIFRIGKELDDRNDRFIAALLSQGRKVVKRNLRPQMMFVVVVQVVLEKKEFSDWPSNKPVRTSQASNGSTNMFCPGTNSKYGPETCEERPSPKIKYPHSIQKKGRCQERQPERCGAKEPCSFLRNDLRKKLEQVWHPETQGIHKKHECDSRVSQWSLIYCILAI